ANSTRPSPCTTATRVASRSKAWKRPLAGARAAAAAAVDFASESLNVSLVALDGVLEPRHAIQVLLVVLGLGTQLVRLAAVEFLLQFRLPRLGLLQLGLEDGAGLGIAGLLLARIDAGARGHHRLDGLGVGARALDDRDVAAHHGLAAHRL